MHKKQADLINGLPVGEATERIGRREELASTGCASMSKGGTKAIGIGSHESIFETAAELGGPALSVTPSSKY